MAAEAFRKTEEAGASLRIEETEACPGTGASEASEAFGMGTMVVVRVAMSALVRRAGSNNEVSVKAGKRES